MTPTPPIRTPMSRDLLLTLTRGLGLSTGHHLLDICCRDGGASLLLAAELGVRVTAIDPDESALARARASAAAHDLGDQVEFLQMDPRHIELPVEEYDAVLALGGVATAFGLARALERIRVHLRPAGWLIASDPVYLDSPPPAAVRAWLGDLTEDDGVPLIEKGNVPSPIVRAVFEAGHLAIGTEAEYRALLEALGYRTRVSCLVPESAWAEYFAHGEIDSEDLDNRRREAAAYYGYGGRGVLGYLLAAAQRPTLEEEAEEGEQFA